MTGARAAVSAWLAAAAAGTAAAVAIWAAVSAPSPGIACHLDQPVYLGASQVGTWTATLLQNQQITLPDGDTAVCTPHGLKVK